MPVPFDHPSELAGFLAGEGFSPSTNISVGQTYGRVFVADDALFYRLSAQILVSASDPVLRVGFGLYFQSDQKRDVERHLTALVGRLYAACGFDVPTDEMAAAFTRAGEVSPVGAPLRINVVYPAEEPDQDFAHRAISVARALAAGEWEQWIAAGLFADKHVDQSRAEGVVREVLGRNGHILAAAAIDHVMHVDMGDEWIDTFTAGDSTLMLTRKASGGAALSVIGSDGTVLELV